MKEALGTKADVNSNSKSSKRKSIVTIVIIVLIIIPVVWIVDWIIVESSPIGRYYHYTYQIDITPDNGQDFTILLPVINLDNGEMADIMEELIDLGYEIEDSRFGVVLNITNNDEIHVSAHGSFDAIIESSDYRSDHNPTFSTWNETISPEEQSYMDLSGSLWIFSSVNNIELIIRFSSWYKSWHIREGIFHNGYKRGGGGYRLYGSDDTNDGWCLLNISGSDIAVE